MREERGKEIIGGFPEEVTQTETANRRWEGGEYEGVEEGRVLQEGMGQMMQSLVGPVKELRFTLRVNLACLAKMENDIWESSWTYFWILPVQKWRFFASSIQILPFYMKKN